MTWGSSGYKELNKKIIATWNNEIPNWMMSEFHLEKLAKSHNKNAQYLKKYSFLQ